MYIINYLLLVKECNIGAYRISATIKERDIEIKYKNTKEPKSQGIIFKINNREKEKISYICPNKTIRIDDRITTGSLNHFFSCFIKGPINRIDSINSNIETYHETQDRMDSTTCHTVVGIECRTF